MYLLLKILLTNFCRVRLPVLREPRRPATCPARASRSMRWCSCTLDFYRRNCIEGLFLSSGIIQSPDYTMEQVVEVARVLREEHDFRGYIHLKTIPDASPELMPARRPLRRTGCPSTSSCPRPRASRPGTGEKQRRHRPVDGPHGGAHRRVARGTQGTSRAGHRLDAAVAHHAPGQRAAVCARRAKHADDRGGRCDG